MSRKNATNAAALLTKSMKDMGMQKLEIPYVHKIKHVRLPPENSPFSPMEQMVYSNIFGKPSKQSANYLADLRFHRKNVFSRLSRSEILGSTEFAPPFPDISPGTRRIERSIDFLQQSDLVLITKVSSTALSKHLVGKLRLKHKSIHHTDSQTALASIWGVDKLDPLDYWRAGAVADFPLNTLFQSGEECIMLNFERNEFSETAINSVLDGCRDEITPAVAILKASIFENEANLEKIVQSINSPWLIKEEGSRRITLMLQQLAVNGLTRSTVGPGNCIYIHN